MNYGHNPSELRVGSSTLGQGQYIGPRSDRTGALVVSAAHGKYMEACAGARIFAASARTLTLAAGNLVGHTAAASTNTCLFNPVGSGVTIALLRVDLGFTSGTFAAGGAHLGLMASTTIATSLASAVVPTNLQVGNGAASAVRIQDSDAGAALTGGATSAVGPVLVSTEAVAYDTTSPNQSRTDFDGMILVPPGNAVLPLFDGAGTTVIFNCSYVWEELPYVV